MSAGSDWHQIGFLTVQVLAQYSNNVYLRKSALTSSAADLASAYFLDDVPGAIIPASRLHAVLQKVDAHRPLTDIQRAFLQERGYHALLQLALGSLDGNSFRENAQTEREARLRAKAAAEQREAEEARHKTEATERKNKALFAKREKQLEKRRFREQFGQGYIEQSHYRRVMRILRSVADGAPIDKDDLLWLGEHGSDYWTVELRKAHHGNCARELTQAWHRTGDVWQAVNACAHWRKAGRAEDGLIVVEQALRQVTEGNQRSAVLTTRGGAFRDVQRHDDAMQSGIEAHSLTPEDFRPCTLLGAVCLEMGDYASGADWYEKAEARGASRASVDGELRSILDALPTKEGASMIAALKSRDARRYNWL
ncbi:hypothetical protein DDZ14_03470 [Maritimibacter sp. 55A14]|uniref:hypothetical protein n=1 Tax=Maritimibacter sp. 55A14 TaxID=2174844 RepID=UPI000D61A5E3|nr:hypothetical protein [Maritimibacter sp. 55A14]PWE33736.1 hypothetical protein DDZ14_03470 [Maritimibacter sp. 55A14]